MIGVRSSLGRYARSPVAVGAAVCLALITAMVAAAPLVALALDLDPQAVDLFERFAPASALHPLGTDALGRDVLIRLLYGGQVSLLVGFAAALIAAALGTAIGLCAGYLGGITDVILMRVTDAVIALPLLPLLIVLAAVDLGALGLPRDWADGAGASLIRTIPVLALVGWTTVARLVRGATLAARQQLYVQAAEALGAPALRVMVVHILPNVAAPLIVAATLSAGQFILLESVLSFLGLGIQPPLPSWGNMLTNAQELIWSAPWLAIYPGLLIFATVVCVNLIGDGLQRALDPRGPLDPGG